MAPTKKKKPTRSERNAQKEEREAAAEAARGRFNGGSRNGGDSTRDNGNAGGEQNKVQANGYPSLNLSTCAESFGLPPAFDELTGHAYPALPPSSLVEKSKAKQYPDGMVYNNVPLNDYHGLTNDLVSAREAHDKLSYQVLAAADKSKNFAERAIVAEEENLTIKAQLIEVVDEMKQTFAKMDL